MQRRVCTPLFKTYCQHQQQYHLVKPFAFCVRNYAKKKMFDTTQATAQVLKPKQESEQILIMRAQILQKEIELRTKHDEDLLVDANHDCVPKPQIEELLDILYQLSIRALEAKNLDQALQYSQQCWQVAKSAFPDNHATHYQTKQLIAQVHFYRHEWEEAATMVLHLVKHVQMSLVVHPKKNAEIAKSWLEVLHLIHFLHLVTHNVTLGKSAQRSLFGALYGFGTDECKPYTTPLTDLTRVLSDAAKLQIADKVLRNQLHKIEELLYGKKKLADDAKTKLKEMQYTVLLKLGYVYTYVDVTVEHLEEALMIFEQAYFLTRDLKGVNDLSLGECLTEMAFLHAQLLNEVQWIHNSESAVALFATFSKDGAIPPPHSAMYMAKSMILNAISPDESSSVSEQSTMIEFASSLFQIEFGKQNYSHVRAKLLLVELATKSDPEKAKQMLEKIEMDTVSVYPYFDMHFMPYFYDNMENLPKLVVIKEAWAKYYATTQNVPKAIEIVTEILNLLHVEYGSQFCRFREYMTYRLAMLLDSQGKQQESHALLQESLQRMKLANKRGDPYYRMAKDALGELDSSDTEQPTAHHIFYELKQKKA